MPEGAFRAGVAATLPLLPGVVAFALLLGGLGAQAGMSPLETGLMSALVFAGGSQFVAVGMWTQPVPVIALAVMALLVNARHVLFGASLAPALRHVPSRHALPAMFFLTDECFALAMAQARGGPLPLAWWLGLGIGLWLVWVAATSLGTVLGAVMVDPARWGLDFAFVATFIGLARGFWRGRATILPWLVAAAAAIAAERLLGSPWHVLAGAAAAMLLVALRRTAPGPAGTA